MNPNITNTVDQPLFYASLTNDQPPRLSVCFSPGGGFKKDGIDCPGSFVAKAGRQIKICLEDKTVMNEAAADLASLHDCGRSLAFREIRAGDRTTYFYEDDNEQAEGASLSQVTLQVRNASLVAEFFQGAAGPVVPVVPGVARPSPIVQGPEIIEELVNVPPVETVAAAQDKLTGSLTAIGIGEWYLYAECLKNPSLSYTAKYKQFLEKEKALLNAQEDPKPAISEELAQNKLRGSLTEIGIGEWYLYVECLKNPFLSYTAKYKQFLEKEKALLNAQEVKNP